MQALTMRLRPIVVARAGSRELPETAWWETHLRDPSTPPQSLRSLGLAQDWAGLGIVLVWKMKRVVVKGKGLALSRISHHHLRRRDRDAPVERSPAFEGFNELFCFFVDDSLQAKVEPN